MPFLNDISHLLLEGMGPHLHWFPEDVSLSKLAAILVGMANTAGGTVLVGITPRGGKITGVRHPEELLDRVFQAALLADPSLILPLPVFRWVDDKQVLSITVPAGMPHVYNLEGRYLWRDGSQTNPIPARRLRQLLLERGVIQFESKLPPQATLGDLDRPRMEAYAAAIQLPGADNSEEVILRRGCLRSEAGQLRPTYAALLLFGRHPQQWLPSATILATRFSGVAFGDHYIKQEMTGTLPDQLRQAEGFARENLRSVVRLTGLNHVESLEYPFEAVRELLVNAVAHRDYNTQGDNIHLNLFADRLEVTSPGGLPGPVNLENLLEARFSRNPVIVQVLADLGFVERLGYGLDRVVRVMRENGLRPPRFEEVAGAFKVVLFNQPIKTAPEMDLSADQTLDLNPRQEKAVDYLASNRRITNSDYQAICPQVHPETLRRDLADLVSRGMLVKIGDKRATYYVLKKGRGG